MALSGFAVAGSVATLIGARLLQGLGSTAVWPTATVLLAEWGGRQQGASFGRYQTISVLGAGVGTGWTGLVTLLLDGQTRATLGRLVTLPAWLPAPWPQLALLHLIFAGNAACAAVALGCAALLRAPARTVPAERLRWSVPGWLRPLLVCGAVSGAASGLLAPVQVVLLEQRFGQGLVGIALAYGLPGVLYALVPAPAGRWADRVGYRRAATLGLLLPLVGYALIPLATSQLAFTLCLCLEAVGLSILVPAIYALVGAGSPAQRGQSYGLYTFAGGLGGALTQAVGGWLYQHAGAGAPFWLAAALMGLSAAALYGPGLAPRAPGVGAQLQDGE